MYAPECSTRQHLIYADLANVYITLTSLALSSVGCVIWAYTTNRW